MQAESAPYLNKKRTKYDTHPTDFTGGTVSSMVAHTLQTAVRISGLKDKLLSVPRLAQLAQQVRVTAQHRRELCFCLPSCLLPLQAIQLVCGWMAGMWIKARLKLQLSHRGC